MLFRLNVCYIIKHLEDRKALYIHIYYTWCDIILIFKLHRRTWLTPRSSIHSLKIRMTSHPCNKYEHITLSYLPSVKYTLQTPHIISPYKTVLRIVIRVQFWFQSPKRCIIKHLKHTKLYTIEFLRTEMTSYPSNYHKEYSFLYSVLGI